VQKLKNPIEAGPKKKCNEHSSVQAIQTAIVLSRPASNTYTSVQRTSATVRQCENMATGR